MTFPSVAATSSLAVDTVTCSVRLLSVSALIVTSNVSDGTSKQNLKQTPQVVDTAGSQQYVLVESVGQFSVGGGGNPTATLLIRSTASTSLSCSLSGTLSPL